MTRLYFDPIVVECEDDRPHAFTWRHQLHRITAILKRWVVRVDWWRREVNRHYYKVQCDDLGIYEIYREIDLDRERWILERLYD